MPDLWMPGATRLDIGDHAPTDGGPDKALAHITWDENADASHPIDLVPYERLVDWFGRNADGKKAAPHILWDPFTGRFTQFVPADSRSKSVVDLPGGTRTNRAGDNVIQIEALFFPYCRVGGRVYARLVDTPCKGWAQLHAWVRSWGVPDRWPMGRPVDFTSHRDEETWETQGGWYGHSQVPENDHQDPGSWPAFTTEEPDLDANQAKQLAEIYNTLVPFMGWQYKGKDAGVDAYADLRNASTQASATARSVTALSAKVDALTAKVASLEATGLTPEQITAIANAVADVQARRLAE